MNIDDIRFTPELRLINDKQIERIDGAIMDVLERTGIQMTHKKALDLLDGAGARVDGNKVKIPSWMVKKALTTAPSRINLGNRFGKTAVTLGGRRNWFGPSLDCIYWQDPATNERTRYTSERCRQNARLAEHSDNYTWTMVIGLAAGHAP